MHKKQKTKTKRISSCVAALASYVQPSQDANLKKQPLKAHEKNN